MFQSFDQITTLTYVLMDIFCPCFNIGLIVEKISLTLQRWLSNKNTIHRWETINCANQTILK